MPVKKPNAPLRQAAPRLTAAQVATAASRWKRGRARKVAGAQAYVARRTQLQLQQQSSQATSALNQFDNLVSQVLGLNDVAKEKAATSATLVPFINANTAQLPQHAAYLALTQQIQKWQSLVNVNGSLNEIRTRIAADRGKV